MLKRKNKAILCAIASIAVTNSAVAFPVNAMVVEQTANSRAITKMEVYNTSSLNIRKGAGTKYAKIGTASRGQVLEVVSISNGWAKINYNNGIGYCSASYLKKVENTTPTPSTKQMIVKVDDLSVRKGAGAKYTKLGSLNKGDKVTVVSELSNGWVKIEFKKSYGYVSNVKGAYLEVVTTSNPSVPSEPTTPDSTPSTPGNTPTTPDTTPSTPDTTPSTKQMVVKVDDLSVRKGAGTKYTKLGSLNKGDKVTVVSELSSGWVKIEFKKSYGYVSNVKGAYLEELVDVNQQNANKVMAMIDALKTDLTLDDENAVKEARDAFDKLNDEAKALVNNLTKLTDAEAKIASLNAIEAEKVNDIMDKIDELFDMVITFDNVEAGKQKVEEIEALIANVYPPDVQNIGNLYKLEAKIKEIETVESNIANASSVRRMIDDLNKDIDVNDEEAILSARDAYESLTLEAKALVGDIAVLESAEAKIESIMERVGAVIDLIDALPVKIELTHEQQVIDVTTAFNNLSVDEQNKIPFPQRWVLESANAVISSLKKEEADKVIVAELINRINLLKDEVINIDDHEKEIKEIRAKYEALGYARQVEVTNYDELEKAEWKLDRIYEAVIYLEGLIIPLPEQIEIEHSAIVEDAKRRYEDLGDKNQSKVNPEYKLKLDRAIAQLEVLKQEILQNNEEVKEIVADIEQLPEVDAITINDKAEIYRLVRKYEELPEDVKFAVDATTLEESFDKIETLMAQEVVSLIDTLPSIDELNLTHSSTLKEIRAKYDEISSRNNTKVTNISILTELEVKMLELENVNPVIIDIVNKIKDLDHTITFDNFDETLVKVDEIEALLQTISLEEFDLITNLTKYEEVLTQIDILNRVSDVTTGAQVVAMITALPEVALIDFSHGDELTDIRNAYAKISADEKLLVNNLDKLEQAEAEYNRVIDITNNIISAIHRIPEIDKLTINDETIVNEAKELYYNAEEKVKHYINHMNVGHLENALIKIEQLKNQA